LFLPVTGFTQTSCLTREWPYELSDIKPAPGLVRGSLPNGLRYVIKQNNKPEKRVAIYLDVQAGSFQESDKQRGLAHFLEHMMFNGSDHFPPGTLIDYFQSIGMGFGNDANAHTGYNETVYNLFLPDGSKEVLEKGLLVIADYARGALLLESEVNRERGVILAEKRTRDSASYRSRIARTDYAFRGTRVVTRRVIGLVEVLENADRELLKSYYDAWYRPENMVLVIVGDIVPSEVQKIIVDKFTSLHAGASRPDCPDFGQLDHKGIETFYHYEPELGKTKTSIEALWDITPENDSIALETRELSRYISSMIIRYRLQKLREKTDTPLIRTGYYYGDIADRIGYGSISAESDPENWQESLALINYTLRQALEFGFSGAELARAEKEILAGFDAAVFLEKSEDSRGIARKIICNINSNRVYQSAEQEQKIYSPILKKITSDQVNSEFRKIWKPDNRLISIGGNIKLGTNANKTIRGVYKTSLKQPLSDYDESITESFPYLLPPGKTSSYQFQELSPELDIERVVFDNGLILNLKKTTFSENSLQLTVSYGHGKLQEPVPGMAMLAEEVINGSGTGKFTRSQFDAILAGSSVDLRFGVKESSYLWKGSCLKKDSDLLLQVLYTRLFDPGLRKSVFDSVVSDMEQTYKGIEHDVTGGMPLKIESFLASGNPRFGLPPWRSVAAIDYQQLVDWVQTIVMTEGLEISVVGDFDREQFIDGIQKYFSGIKLKLLENSNITLDDVVFPGGKTISVDVDTSIGKSFILAAWKTDDFWDISRTRRLHILASVFENRLIKVVREKLGATYSPLVYSSNSRTYKGYGFLAAQMVVKPGEEEKITKEIVHQAELLRSQGVTDEEVSRAKGPLITSITDSLKSNSYWLNSVLSESSRYPEQLQWPQSILSGYSAISREEINHLAKKYLIKEKVATALVRPVKEGEKSYNYKVKVTNE